LWKHARPGFTKIIKFNILELGEYMHPCEEDLICKCSNEKIPYFNAPVFLKDKSQIGKVDDIFGPINEFVSFLFFFSIISQHLSIFSKFDF
jgi:H/ACA ribonucleoprotein complex subunit 1